MAGAVGAIISSTAGVAIGEKQTQIDIETDKLKATSGYTAANYDYKSSQILRLVSDYSLGVMTDKELMQRLKHDNLSNLDLNAYVETNFNEQEKNEYFKLIDQRVHYDNLQKLAQHCILAAIVVVGVSMGLYIDKRTKEIKHETSL